MHRNPQLLICAAFKWPFKVNTTQKRGQEQKARHTRVDAAETEEREVVQEEEKALQCVSVASATALNGTTQPFF